MNIKKIFKINILVLTFICLLLISSCGGKKPEYVAKKYSYFGYLDTMSYITVQFDKKQVSIPILIIINNLKILWYNSP